MTSRAGFIQLPRFIVERFRRPFTRSEALIWLFYEASYQARKYYVGDKPIELKRGQLAHSTRYMAKAWRWSQSAVMRFLNSLKIEKIIGSETGSGVTVINPSTSRHRPGIPQRQNPSREPWCFRKAQRLHHRPLAQAQTRPRRNFGGAAIRRRSRRH
jgi:hypothetical protein